MQIQQKHILKLLTLLTHQVRKAEGPDDAWLSSSHTHSRSLQADVPLIEVDGALSSIADEKRMQLLEAVGLSSMDLLSRSVSVKSDWECDKRLSFVLLDICWFASGPVCPSRVRLQLTTHRHGGLARIIALLKGKDLDVSALGRRRSEEEGEMGLARPDGEWLKGWGD